MKKPILLGAALAALLTMPFSAAHGQSAPPDPDAINYGALNNSVYSYGDLKQAQARDLSDTQIAKIAKIAEITGMPFEDILNAVVIQGKTFVTLANEDGFPLSDLDNVRKEKDEIANFQSAYETSGAYAFKVMMPSPEAPGPMPAPMTPPAPKAATAVPPMAPAPEAPPALTPSSAGDVVDVAIETPQLSMLVKAIQAAGLVDTLRGAGPFTLFAPDNKAFSRLPKSRRNALMADPTALKNLLSYHVIAGQKIDAVTAMSMTSPTSPPTVEGATLNVTTSNGKVHINDATVTRADIQASNGIIHIIDRVLMPPTP